MTDKQTIKLLLFMRIKKHISRHKLEKYLKHRRFDLKDYEALNIECFHSGGDQNDPAHVMHSHSDDILKLNESGNNIVDKWKASYFKERLPVIISIFAIILALASFIVSIVALVLQSQA